MCVRLYTEIQNKITERGAVTKGKGQHSFTKRKTGECFQWKRNVSCSKKRSVCACRGQQKMGCTGESRLRHATGNRELKKKIEQASCSVPKVTEQTDVQSSNGRGASAEIRARIPCLCGAKCKRSSCDRHPPVCRNYKSGNRCIHGNNCLYRHDDGDKNLAKGRQKRVLRERSCHSEGK